MSTNHRFLLGCFLALVAGGSLAPQARAIPAWARRTEMSCVHCHAPFPRLNPTGQEFEARGFRLSASSAEPPASTADLGDPLLALPRELPLSIRIEGFASWKEGATARTDVEWPAAFKIISGGPITPSVSYYVYFLTEQGAVVGLEDAWLSFRSVLRLPLDVTAGEFQLSDPMFERELRLERADYDILAARVGRSTVDLTYDRGVRATWHAPGSLDAVVSVTNGNGIGAADSLGNFDSDPFKVGTARLAWTAGGARLGAFGYLGRQKGPVGRTNRTSYLGPDVVLDLGDRWTLSGEYLERRDTDPMFAGAGGAAWITRGGFAEATFLPLGVQGRWILTGLFSRVNSRDGAARSETGSLTVNYLLARNLRMLVEGARDLRADRSRATVGLITAF